MKREISMNGADALPMLNEVEQQGDIRVAKILRTRWDMENDAAFAWSTHRCAACEGFLFAGDVGHVWGKPISDDPQETDLHLITFCVNEECVTRAMEAWAYQLKKDVMAAYFGDFDDDDLDLE